MLLKKQIFGWSIYDLANTIFSALFVTIYFPLFVVLKGGTAFHVGLVMSLSMLLAGFLVPFFGALADVTQRKKFFLFLFTLLCCIFTFFTGFFDLVTLLFFGLFANFFYNASLDIYDSFLVNLSNSKNIGKISGIGTAVGYLGTILSIGIAYLVGYKYGFETILGIKIIFILTALSFFLISLITFYYLKETSKTKIKIHHFKQAFNNVAYTIKGIKKHKNLWLFLLSSFLYVDAANTTVVFLYLYARDQLQLSLVQFLPIYLVMALSAFFGAMIFGYLSDKFRPKRTLLYVLFLWIGVILLLYFKTTFTTFLIVGIFGGALLGGIWTITRPILVELAPKEKITEYFGYQGLTEKFSGVIGPFFFGYIAILFGFKPALLIVIGLFLLGAFVLSLVKMDKS